jgi:hypothetical protein
METCIPETLHRKVSPPDGPPLRPGETSAAQVRAWRRERIAYCVASLLRDPAVARAVAAGLAECRVAEVRDEYAGQPDGAASRIYWLDARVRRG